MLILTQKLLLKKKKPKVIKLRKPPPLFWRGFLFINNNPQLTLIFCDIINKINKFMPKIVKFLLAVLLCEGAGIVGSFFTTPSIGSWYATLSKPSFNPPNWIFAPVWTLLFFLMGVSLYLVWCKKDNLPVGGKRVAVLVFFQQLSLNILWSALFFGLHNPFLAFCEIILLWLSILMTIFYFSKISKAAAWLLLPYILWVSFAAFLNFSIWRLMV